jgi:hypothetical protein
MSDEQKKNIATILADETKELTDLAPKFGGGGKGKGGGADFKGNQEKMETVRKEAKEKIYTVLSKEQRKSWRDLIGEEFKFTTGGFGGGFGGFGKGKDAKDAKDAKKETPKDK